MRHDVGMLGRELPSITEPCRQRRELCRQTLLASLVIRKRHDACSCQEVVENRTSTPSVVARHSARLSWVRVNGADTQPLRGLVNPCVLLSVSVRQDRAGKGNVGGETES